MNRLLSTSLAASLTFAAASFAAPAEAGECVYPDIKGQFTLSMDCEVADDFSNPQIQNQDHRRMWLAGDWVQVSIIEVPEAYRTVSLDELSSNMGRFWTNYRNPQPITETTLGGLDARVFAERKLRFTSRYWAFALDGRNVTARIMVSGKKTRERDERLALVTAAFEKGFVVGGDMPAQQAAPAPAPAAAPEPAAAPDAAAQKADLEAAAARKAASEAKAAEAAAKKAEVGAKKADPEAAKARKDAAQAEAAAEKAAADAEDAAETVEEDSEAAAEKAKDSAAEKAKDAKDSVPGSDD